MKSILNIAAYLFVSLDGLPELRAKMLDECNARQLKGTILLTGEGINMFLAGKADALRGFLDWLRLDPRFTPLQAKESWSEDQPFKKMLIKLKNEIIRMNHPAIRPEEGRANFISPKKLQEAEAKYGQLNGAYADLQSKYRDAQDATAKAKNDADKIAAERKSLEKQVADLNKQIDFLKENNNVVLGQLKDMSVVTGAQAESI